MVSPRLCGQKQQQELIAKSINARTSNMFTLDAMSSAQAESAHCHLLLLNLLLH